MSVQRDWGLPEGLKVWFEYDETLRAPSGRLLMDKDGRGVPRRRTTAHVYEVRLVGATMPDGVAVRREVARGVAVCNPCDPFVKETGRSTAIKRVLEELEAR